MTSTMTYTFLGDGTGDYILEQNDYLPFGTRMPLKTQATNRYRYAGKEEQNIAGMDLGLLDFGARYYDAFTCRWNAIDPLAHKYFGMSPYNYCGNDPVNKVDPDGMTDYFDNDGNSLLSDSNDNGEIRITTQDTIDDAKQYWGEEWETVLVSDGYSTLFHSAVNSSNMSEDAVKKVYEYCNTTGVPIQIVSSGEHSFFVSIDNPEIIQINAKRASLSVWIDGQKYYLHDNKYNNTSTLKHEAVHTNQVSNGSHLEHDEAELEAYNQQMSDESYGYTTPEYKKYTENNRSRYESH